MPTFSAQKATGSAIDAHRIVHLPKGMDNLSVVDQSLYGYNGLLFYAPLIGEPLFNFQPDTLINKIAGGADYIVRNPRDSVLYFTRHDADDITHLYTVTDSKFRPIHRVDIHGWHRDICHPTFSANGQMMIFSSNGKVGLGGYDLWCSLWNGHRWTRPINLGNMINTPGNDINPVFYNNYLIFASDSVPNNKPGYHLYSLYIREASSIDEIIFNTYTIQPLPYPINSDGNDANIAFDHTTHQGWWVSTRSGNRELYSFTGKLEGVMLSGNITDKYQRPVSNASIKLCLHGQTIARTVSDSEGFYELFVAPDDDYILQVSSDGYFSQETKIPLVRASELRLLINPLTHNIQLASLPLNQPILLHNIFNNDADIELAAEASKELWPIVNFLHDNPKVKAKILVYCNQTYSENFKETLINHRINSLHQFLHSLLPSDAQFSIQNGFSSEETEPSNTDANTIFIRLIQ